MKVRVVRGRFGSAAKRAWASWFVMHATAAVFAPVTVEVTLETAPFGATVRVKVISPTAVGSSCSRKHEVDEAALAPTTCCASAIGFELPTAVPTMTVFVTIAPAPPSGFAASGRAVSTGAARPGSGGDGVSATGVAASSTAVDGVTAIGAVADACAEALDEGSALCGGEEAHPSNTRNGNHRAQSSAFTRMRRA